MFGLVYSYTHGFEGIDFLMEVVRKYFQNTRNSTLVTHHELSWKAGQE